MTRRYLDQLRPDCRCEIDGIGREDFPPEYPNGSGEIRLIMDQPASASSATRSARLLPG